ncbi:biotin attachment protein [Caloranaerobacter sp. TR13]|uniref:biotin/lipoyl-containing protein n=1 Tax=Caloranaerobacter sp. TR13 TaxID=1302151 RepID=UPI0006D4887D|nr:biotin/lipoyl-containing protein [Caloranaerobacter sp. TR13]KPU26611.1 biotin attachment protein [Caloranaerobacter sp. TR13]
MKKYIITVNGKKYEVEVEEVRQGAPERVSAPVVTKPVVKTPQKEVKREPKAEPKKEVETKPALQGAETVEAPMPGTILDIKVKEGDNVKGGQVLVILEAMKMENEIVAPRDGKVVSINTTKGASVNAGDPLVSLE